MSRIGNHIFLVGVRMVARLFHSTHLKEVLDAKFVQAILTSSLCMCGLASLSLQVFSKCLSGDQDLSLFENFVVFLPSAPLCSCYLHLVVQLCCPLLIQHDVFLVFRLVFDLLAL